MATVKERDGWTKPEGEPGYGLLGNGFWYRDAGCKFEYTMGRLRRVTLPGPDAQPMPTAWYAEYEAQAAEAEAAAEPKPRSPHGRS